MIDDCPTVPGTTTYCTILYQYLVMILKERGNESSYECYCIAMFTSTLSGAVRNQKNILVPCGYDIPPDGYWVVLGDGTVSFRSKITGLHHHPHANCVSDYVTNSKYNQTLLTLWRKA